MKLVANETELIGEWYAVDGKVVSNEACGRIWELVNDYLVHVAKDWSGWERLLMDPADGRYWELTHPKSELHGGGPPALRVIDQQLANSKYGITGLVEAR